MRKILLIPFLFVSCWSKTPDGREYKIECECLSGHYETETTPQTTLVDNTPTVTIVTENVWVCDNRRCDTVWKNKK